jgi:Flp pilus assembly protein TadG
MMPDRWVRAIMIALVVVVVLGLVFGSMRFYR